MACRSLLVLLAIFLRVLCAAPAQSAAEAPPTAAQAPPAPPRAEMHARHRAFLEEHCKQCHGPERQKGKFRVDNIPFVIEDLQNAERWQKILNSLNSGEMPPEEEKQPPNQAKADFLDDLSNVMVVARRTLNDQNGVITMRRLNRREYKNTLRELLGVEINVAELPSDTGTGGFDTFGANLFMSANQFEQYQSIGLQALDEAFTRFAASGEELKLHIEVEDNNVRIRKNYQDQLEALKRATEWAKGVEVAAARPENATVVAELRNAAKNQDLFLREWSKIKARPPRRVLVLTRARIMPTRRPARLAMARKWAWASCGRIMNITSKSRISIPARI